MKPKPTPQPAKLMTRLAKHQTPVFWSILATFSMALVLYPVGDVDIWWHIGMGKGMLTHGWLPPATDFYWSPVAYEIPADLRFTWLGDLLFAMVFKIGGAVGLQLLAVAALGLCLWFLWDMAGRVHSGRNLLILLLFVAGTYQMQIVRNAIFGLPGTMAILWLWWRIHDRYQQHLWWVFPPLLCIWSCLHGTYLFGFGLLFLLIGGETLDRIRLEKPFKRSDLLRRTATLLLSYGAIAIFNPFTWVITKSVLDMITGYPIWLLTGSGLILSGFLFLAMKLPKAQKPRVLGTSLLVGLLGGALLLFFRHFKPYFSDSQSLANINLRAYKATVNLADLGFFGRIKHGLNNTFWKSDIQQMASVDFFSPFDFMGDIYVWTSLILLLLAGVILWPKPNRQLAHLLPFAATIFLGLGYIRTIGFITIFAAYLLMVVSRDSRHGKQLARFFWPTASLMVVLALIGSLSPANPLGFFADHRFQLGQATYFPEVLGEETLEQYPEALVFTTIENGGFLLNQWYPDKKVFMDGFFRPHEGQTFLDYTRVLGSKDPEHLYQRYGVTLAIIGMRDSSWFEVFNTARGWVPRMADRGGVLFERNLLPPANYQFKLLMTDHAWSQTPPYLRKVVALRLYDMGFKLLSEGLLIQAIDFLESDDPLFQKIQTATPTHVRESFEKSILHLKAQYGISNHPLIRTEFQLTEAIQQNDYADVLRLGEALVTNQPHRLDVWQALMTTAEKMGNTKLVETYRLHRDQSQQP